MSEIINPNELADKLAESKRTMTVEEMLEKLQKMPRGAKVYILADTKEDNWDCENERWISVLPVKFVIKEQRMCFDGWEQFKETNVLLQVADEQ